MTISVTFRDGTHKDYSGVQVYPCTHMGDPQHIHIKNRTHNEIRTLEILDKDEVLSVDRYEKEGEEE